MIALHNPPESSPNKAELWGLLGFATAAHSIVISYGTLDVRALILVLLSVVFCLLIIVRNQTTTLQSISIVSVWFVAFAASLVVLCVRVTRINDWMPGPHLWMPASAVMVLLSYIFDFSNTKRLPPWFYWMRRCALLCLGLLQGLWLLAAEKPSVDVWHVHQQGSAALLQGVSPYETGKIDTVDTYNQSRQIDDYAYPPANLVLTTIGYLATKDSRYSQLAAQMVGVLLLWLLAYKRSQNAMWADLVAACLCFHPKWLFILEQAYGEMLAVPFLIGVPLALSFARPMLAAILLGVLVSLKQYYFIFFISLMWLPGFRVVHWLTAVGTALATVIPFVIWTPHELWRNLAEHHLSNPFRPDSLSISAWVYTEWGKKISRSVGLVASFAPFLFLLRKPRHEQTLLAVCSLALLVFFLFGRQAFCNYYYLVSVTLLVAVALTSSPTEQRSH